MENKCNVFKMEVEVAARRSFVSRCIASIAFAICELLRRWFIWIITAGPIPKHVAIIMDGNRRYAARRQMEKTSGHQFGYDSLMHTLRDCFDLGIKCVSVYAFSIENFKRSKEEVATLMNLMQEKLEALIEKESMVTEYGIRVQVLGELSLLPESVRRAAEKAMAMSRGNEKAVLNIFAPYTSTQEIVKAVENVRHEVLTRKIEVHEKIHGFHSQDDDDGSITEEIHGLQSSVTEDEIERHLYTADCGEPQLLIRTSGEIRLSNFLLWQSSFTFLYVTPVLWPEFSFWQLVKAILDYQKAYPLLQQKKRQLKSLISRNA
uniref:Alkyl transferase n=1 Tax=Picea sitchensis TaxID=3332 RepID=D5AB96_PICSI|nr:unknown [Picea sitchensis]